jgi:hypothetical protein
MNLKDIASRDRIHDFPVELVREYRFTGPKKKSSELEFLIKWKGFGPEWDTWEPYKNVRLNETVIEFMRANKLKTYIPKNLEIGLVNHITSKKSVTFAKDLCVIIDEGLTWIKHKYANGRIFWTTIS